jgi:hypothetical protein
MARSKMVRMGAVAAAAVLILTGCGRWPELTVRGAPDTGITFRLLADDGAHVVVQTTAAVGSIPGAGWWRVERADGEAVPLPGTASRISADGARVLLDDGRLWDEGTLRTLSGVLSTDLGHRIFLDGGVVKVEDLVTGVVRNAEAGHPRPAGTTAVTPMGVSDDGATAWYRVNATSGGFERFARDGAPSVDLPLAGSSTVMVDGVPTPATTRYHLAAGGLAVAQEIQASVTNEIAGGTVESRYRIVELPSGVELRSVVHTHPGGAVGLFEQVKVFSDDGTWLWVHEFTRIDNRSGNPACPQAPIFLTCVIQNRLFAISVDGGERVDELGPYDLRGFDVTADGRTAVLNVSTRPSAFPSIGVDRPPQVVDGVDGKREMLHQGVKQNSNDPARCQAAGQPVSSCELTLWGSAAHITDDGSLIAARTMSGTGWYEYQRPAD